MASGIFFSAQRSQEIEDNAINSGFVDASGKLILVKHNGTQIDAGNVKGPAGDNARYDIPGTNSLAGYIRLVTLDGVELFSGASYNGLLSALGNYGVLKRTTVLFHATLSGADQIDLKAWGWDIQPSQIKLYTRKLGSYFYEIWMYQPGYPATGTLTELASWHAVRNLDSFTSAMPSDLIEVPIVSSSPVTSPTAAYNNDGTITVKAIDDASIKTGILEASYRSGKARVKIDGVLSSEAYGWLSRYNPYGSREVKLIRTSSGWVISGQTDEKNILLPYGPNWSSYGELAANWAGGARASLLPSGIVVLKGMLGAYAAPTDGEVIATLPVGYRPDSDTIFPVQCSEQPRTVRVNASGQIMVYGSGWASSWLTLDGIAFPSAGTATWTNIGSGGSSWGSSFQREANWAIEYGEPGFWKDPYGFVWYRGLAQVKTAVSTDNTELIKLPTTHRSSVQEHIRATGNKAYAGIGSRPDSGLTWKPNSPGTVGSHISLGGVITKTSDAYSLNPWTPSSPRMRSSWVQYPGSVTVPRYLLREDGLRVLSGMISGGSLESPAWIFRDQEMVAELGHLTMPTLTNNGAGRITVHAGWFDGDDFHNSLHINNGSNAWYSLDNRVYVP